VAAASICAWKATASSLVVGIDLEDLAFLVPRRGWQRQIRRRHRLARDEAPRLLTRTLPRLLSTLIVFVPVYVSTHQRLVVRRGRDGRAAIARTVADHVVDQ
jgi:hypothetical protein